MSEIPEIPEGYVDQIFEAISKMEVELDVDPLQYGPKRLNNKIVEARGHLTECERIFLDVSRLLQKFKSVNRDLEVEFEISKKELFANDPEVRALPHVTDREALATMKLRSHVEEMNKISRNVPDLEALMTVIKAKRTDLKDVQGRIRDQIRLCHEEIGLGGIWGSKPPPGSPKVDLEQVPKVPVETIRDLRDLFDNSSSPEILDSKVISPEGINLDEFEGEGSDNSIDGFLDSLESNSPVPSPKTDLESILDGLEI